MMEAEMTASVSPEMTLIKSESVKIGDFEIRLYGLSLPHVIAIVSQHRSAMESLYTKAVTGQLGANIESLVLELGDSFGSVAGMVIGLSSRLPEHSDLFGFEIPISEQLEALEKIVGLTIGRDGSNRMGKIVEIIGRAVAAMQQPQSQET